MSNCIILSSERQYLFIKKEYCIKLHKEKDSIHFELYDISTYFGIFFKSSLLETRVYRIKDDIEIYDIISKHNELDIVFKDNKTLNVILNQNLSLKFTYRTV